MASTNEILGSIYVTLLSVDKKLKGFQKSNKEGGTKQNSFFGFSQAPTGAGGGSGFSDMANGMKTLSGVKFSDFVMISMAPLGLIAKKVKGFYTILGDIDKKTTNNAKKNIESFTSIIAFVEKQNPAKLWMKFKLFPSKEINKFLTSLIDINKNLIELSKEGELTDKQIKSIRKSLGVYTEIKNTIEGFGMGDIIKLYISKKVIASSSLVVLNLTRLGRSITNIYNPAFSRKLRMSNKSIRQFTRDLNKMMGILAIGGALSTVLLPVALIGLGSYYVTVKATGLLASAVTKAHTKTRTAKKAMSDILLFMGGMTLLTVALISTGMIVTKYGGGPALLLGISALSGALVAIWSLSALVKYVGNASSTKSNMAAVKNIAGFLFATTFLMFSIAGVGIMLSQVGGWKAVGLGVVMLSVSMLGILALSYLTNFVGKKAGSKKTKSSMMQILGFVGAAFVLSIGIIMVGAMLNAMGGWKTLGLGITMMAASLVMVWGLTWLVKFVGGASKKALPSFKQILLFVGASVLLAVSMIALGLIASVAGGWSTVGMGLALIGTSLVAVGGIAVMARVVGNLSKKAFLPMLGIIALGGLMILLSHGMVDLGKTVQEAGGWKTIGDALGVVAATIGEMTAITLAIGGLMMIPILPIVMASGIATLTGLSLAFLAITSAAKNMVELGRDVKVEEIKTSALTTNAFIKAMNGMIKDVGDIPLKSILKATAALVPIRGLLWNMSVFAKLLRDFAGEPGYLKVPIGKDKDGNTIFDNKGVNIQETSEAIANGFKTFIEIVIPAVADAEKKTISAKTVWRINQIMAPVAKFAKILQSFTSDMTDPTHPKIRIAKYDENGKLVEGQVVDIVNIGLSLGSGFGSFVETIFRHLEKVNANMVSRGTIKKINKLMAPVSSFVDILSMFESANDNKIKRVVVDEEGKITETREIDIISVGNAISSSFSSFVSVISKSLESVEKLSSDGAKKKMEELNGLTSGISDFAKELENSFSSDDELTKFKKNVDEINDSLSKIGTLYKSSLDEKMTENLPTLKKNHHDFLYALEKDTKSIKKPLKEYIDMMKQLNDQYSKLVPKVKDLKNNAVTFVLDQGTKFETRMDDSAVKKFAEAYTETICPSLQRVISDAIDAVSANIDYKDHDGKSRTATLEFIQK